MKIAEVSERYNLSPDTLRYYERVGLLTAIPRNENGIRDYTEANCRRIEFIKCMRSCGIPVETLTEYISLVEQGDDTISERKALLERQRRLMEEKIKTMQEGLNHLNEKIQNYDTRLLNNGHKLESKTIVQVLP